MVVAMLSVECHSFIQVWERLGAATKTDGHTSNGTVGFHDKSTFFELFSQLQQLIGDLQCRFPLGI